MMARVRGANATPPFQALQSPGRRSVPSERHCPAPPVACRVSP